MTLATISEADAEYARNVGAERPDCAWILSDRDVWYRNPFYSGPAVRHPDDDQEGWENDCNDAVRGLASRRADEGHNDIIILPF